MAYVTPNSTVELFKNIPWDNTYEHSLYFEGAYVNNVWVPASSFQNALFESFKTGDRKNIHQVKVFTPYSYQRKSKDTIKIGVQPDDIYDYNYMRFKNTSHGNKWFYAFITDVEYVNENTALVHYEIDVLQTYVDEIQYKDSYIERMHTATDIIGENLEPEPIDFGDYVNLSDYTPWDFDNYSVLMFYADADVTDVDPGNTVSIEVTNIVEDFDVHTAAIYIALVNADSYGDDTIEWHSSSGTVPNPTYYYNFDGDGQRLDLTGISNLNLTFPASKILIGFSSATYGADVFANPQIDLSQLQIGDVLVFNKVSGD